MARDKSKHSKKKEEGKQQKESEVVEEEPKMEEELAMDTNVSSITTLNLGYPEIEQLAKSLISTLVTTIDKTDKFVIDRVGNVDVSELYKTLEEARSAIAMGVDGMVRKHMQVVQREMKTIADLYPTSIDWRAPAVMSIKRLNSVLHELKCEEDVVLRRIMDMKLSLEMTEQRFKQFKDDATEAIEGRENTITELQKRLKWAEKGKKEAEEKLMYERERLREMSRTWDNEKSKVLRLTAEFQDISVHTEDEHELLRNGMNKEVDSEAT
jgi:hypothetical protein